MFIYSSGLDACIWSMFVFHVSTHLEMMISLFTGSMVVMNCGSIGELASFYFSFFLNILLPLFKLINLRISSEMLMMDHRFI